MKIDFGVSAKGILLIKPSEAPNNDAKEVAIIETSTGPYIVHPQWQLNMEFNNLSVIQPHNDTRKVIEAEDTAFNGIKKYKLVGWLKRNPDGSKADLLGKLVTTSGIGRYIFTDGTHHDTNYAGTPNYQMNRNMRGLEGALPSTQPAWESEPQ